MSIDHPAGGHSVNFEIGNVGCIVTLGISTVNSVTVCGRTGKGGDLSIAQ
jgi:hypothetical protein